MNVTYLQVFLTISLPLMGLAYALLGGIKLQLAERLQLDEGRVGKLVGAFGTMFGPTIMICGFLTDALGRKGVWLAGSAVLAVAIFVLAGTRSFRGALVGVLLLGVGWAAQVNVGNVLMRVSVSKEHLVAAVNFYDFVFGFGAFATPVILALILRTLGYQKGMVALAAVALVPLLLGAFAQMNPDLNPTPTAPHEAEPVGVSALLTSPLFWVIGFAFLFYVPFETSVSGWATTLVTRNTPQDVPTDRANKVAAFGLTGFWLGFTGSRLIVSLSAGLLKKSLGDHMEQKLLLGLAVACTLLMIAVVFLRKRETALAVVLLCGLACGPVFPTMMAALLGSVDETLMGRAVGFFFFFASVGWTVIPAIIGAVARKTNNIQKGFWVAAASSAVFLSLIVVRGFLIKN